MYLGRRVVNRLRIVSDDPLDYRVDYKLPLATKLRR
jgi:hypothetical protein